MFDKLCKEHYEKVGKRWNCKACATFNRKKKEQDVQRHVAGVHSELINVQYWCNCLFTATRPDKFLYHLRHDGCPFSVDDFEHV